MRKEEIEGVDFNIIFYYPVYNKAFSSQPVNSPSPYEVIIKSDNSNCLY
jgi:hypothetical protein